jgi:hypothetical protein
MTNLKAPANRNSWKVCLPLPAKREKLAFHHDYFIKQYEKISLGLIPEVMEDKWFVFMENNILSFHRSWTGVCIYEVHFEKVDDKYLVKEAWVNRDSQQYKEIDSDYDCELLNFLIENLLLGKPIPFPLPSNIAGKLPKGVQQHSISGTGYSEKIYVPKKPRWIEKFKRLFEK